MATVYDVSEGETKPKDDSRSVPTANDWFCLLSVGQNRGGTHGYSESLHCDVRAGMGHTGIFIATYRPLSYA